MKFASTIEPSRPKPSSSTRAPDRRAVDRRPRRRRRSRQHGSAGACLDSPSLAVIGGGYVGCEYAQMYSRFGADVTVFQRGDTLLPDEDPDVSEVIETAFENRNHRQTGTPVTALTGDQRRHPCRRRCRRHRLRHRLGRCPRSGPEHRIRTASSSKTSARHWTRTDSSRTDDSFRTTADGVYAIGDVSGAADVHPFRSRRRRSPVSAPRESEEISTKGRTVPWAVFTDPQIGHVGADRTRSTRSGYEVGVGRQDFADQGKPKALGETEGFVKLVTNAETDELLGRTSSANRAPDRPRTRPRHRTRGDCRRHREHDAHPPDAAGKHQLRSRRRSKPS